MKISIIISTMLAVTVGVHAQGGGKYKKKIEQELEINAENYTNTFKSTHYDIEQRGCDYAEAFYHLHHAHPEGNIYAIVKGTSIDRIQDVVTMGQKSMLMITYGRSTRIQTKVVNVEDLEEIGLRGVSQSPIHVYFPQSTDHEPHDHHHIHDVDDIPNHREHHHDHTNHHHGHHHPYHDDDHCEECETKPEK